MRLSLLLGALVLTLAGAVAAQAPLVQLAEPRDGTVVTEPVITVMGRAEQQARPPATFDVVIVIDTSGSTQVPAAIGSHAAAGRIFTTPPVAVGGPSILQAEVDAARRFVDIANPASTRIGVVTFAQGGPFHTDNAWLEQALTTDYNAVRTALQRVTNRLPQGGTDMVAGLRLAVRELRALDGAESRPRPQARKVILFMTDGFPTLPYYSGEILDQRNVNATLDIARLAARGDIVVNSFCLGREALSAPVVCREAARITGGTYQPVERPADIVNLLPATRLAEVELLSVRNATTGQMARRLDMEASGHFSADVPLAPGANRLVAQMRGAAAEAGMATVVVHYRPAGTVDIKVEPRRTDPELQIRIEREAPTRSPQ